VSKLRSAVRWPFEQVAGAVRNIGGFLRGIDAPDLIPPSIYGTLVWIRDTFPRSLGFAERARMFSASLAFAAVLVISSFGVLTAVGIAWAVFFGSLAALRIFPAVEARWPVDSDSWPFWEVQ
jgi:hypothetical protein